MLPWNATLPETVAATSAPEKWMIGRLWNQKLDPREDLALWRYDIRHGDEFEKKHHETLKKVVKLLVKSWSCGSETS